MLIFNHSGKACLQFFFCFMKPLNKNPWDLWPYFWSKLSFYISVLQLRKQIAPFPCRTKTCWPWWRGRWTHRLWVFGLWEFECLHVVLIMILIQTRHTNVIDLSSRKCVGVFKLHVSPSVSAAILFSEPVSTGCAIWVSLLAHMKLCTPLCYRYTPKL